LLKTWSQAVNHLKAFKLSVYLSFIVRLGTILYQKHLSQKRLQVFQVQIIDVVLLKKQQQEDFIYINNIQA